VARAETALESLSAASVIALLDSRESGMWADSLLSEDRNCKEVICVFTLL
jgi:hypothetical protein